MTETMAPPGTVIRGAGSSGFLRRNKVSANDILEAADKPVPGSGWDKNSAVPPPASAHRGQKSPSLLPSPHPTTYPGAPTAAPPASDDAIYR